MLITIKTKGDWIKTFNWFASMLKSEHTKHLEALADVGVRALESATPKDTGVTAASWSYSIEEKHGKVTITWQNDSSIRTGEPIVILLQYGHGTGTGGYVQGIDYINPALKPVFENIADAAWKVVTR